MFVTSGTAHGATGPTTILGSEVTYNAELLGGIALIQLIKPGTRMLVINFSLPIEMHSGSLAFGAIEGCLHHAAFIQLWRKYGVPTRPVNPGYTSPKIIDFQNGYEKALGALTASLSGASIIGLHGCVHGELAYHPVQSLLDNDIAGMIRRFMEGINFSTDTMALDLIEEIGPIPGNFLNCAHTREWWRKEQFLPRNADRQTYERWKKTGKKSAIDYARDNLEQILISHKPTPLTSNQDEEIERILKEARSYYKEHNMISGDEWREYQKQIASPGYPYA
jgi:trimethylamine--corrinoid protein Co-methyltransferase